jgi:dTDP-glucose pyrophosphorylase
MFADPERFGVVEFDKELKASIEENFGAKLNYT